MPSLQDPVTVGALQLKNRVVLSPLTRCRASAGRIPNELMKEYYVQRSTAGMILVEATAISPMAVGYPDTPGIWTPEQVEGWSAITEAVHQEEGTIVCQLWHVGRVSDPVYLNGETPVSSSAVAVPGHVRLLRPIHPYVTPRELAANEIPGIIADYATAAENARAAGFDGVEIHGANGYLPEQFLKDGINSRTDDYGGSIENRARFMFEAVDAAIAVWGPDRVGLHISPANNPASSDSNPAALYAHVAAEASKRNLAFICSREALTDNYLGCSIRKTFTGAYIANEGFTRESAEIIVETGAADAVAFGRTFIANPDLPRRFAIGSPLNEPDPETFYGGGAEGYTDYPALDS